MVRIAHPHHEGMFPGQTEENPFPAGAGPQEIHGEAVIFPRPVEALFRELRIGGASRPHRRDFKGIGFAHLDGFRRVHVGAFLFRDHHIKQGFISPVAPLVITGELAILIEAGFAEDVLMEGPVDRVMHEKPIDIGHEEIAIGALHRVLDHRVISIGEIGVMEGAAISGDLFIILRFPPRLDPIVKEGIGPLAP
ncbi:MAG: hypothetical protein BWY98_00477 [Tenericutes bacterium ADurb.BinA155]|nr:MAG: hypothetical protein BWY98_00477 [Tenericutes bacterium ADurb.BinA155]